MERKITLPDYKQIPDVGLYLDQVVKYINNSLNSELFTITPTMLTNYVKLKIVPKGYKKTYSRNHLAMFFFIALSKQVLSMDQIRIIFEKLNDENIEDFYEEFVKALDGKNSKNEVIKLIVSIIYSKINLDELIKAS